MEINQINDLGQDPQSVLTFEASSNVFEWEKDLNFNQECQVSSMDEDGDSPVDSMICDSSSRLVFSGFCISSSNDEVVMFVNAGGEDTIESDSTFKFLGDTGFEGGGVFKTDEHIDDAGDYPFIYKTGRFGNFSYKFHSIPPGDYWVDLHFSEIVYTNGPKGMRVFDVYMQEEKVLAEFDVFSIVGANKPLQLVDSRVQVKDDGVIAIRFEGINGSPVVCGICIRKAPKASDSQVSKEYLKCNNCSTEMEFSSAQKKLIRNKATEKYEKKIKELTSECQSKANECHEAWMSLTAANEQLEKVRLQLYDKTFQAHNLDQTVGKQTEELMNLTIAYDRDKNYWSEAVKNLQEKIKKLKEEHLQLSCEAHNCADSIPELSKMVGGVQALVAQCEDHKMKYSEEQAKRKELYNQIQETKGNIRVFCRCRPLNKDETDAGCATIVDFDAVKDGNLGVLTGGPSKKAFKFDRVYTPRDNQVDVFADASPLVVSVLDGYNVCIFAYGQTGTGKTFTMEGTEQNRGVNYRTLEQLFEVAKERSETFSYQISVSVLEVYNEQIRDLLATSASSKKLEIKQSSEGSHRVPGIVEAKVENIREVWNVLQVGSNNRSVASNNINEHSSRSHCMLCVMVQAKNLMNGECTKSKLWLVDLAGSERLAKTDAQGERLKEAQNINKSLSALGDVIHALATKSSHIPYRNSKLTHLLQDSLGGDSKTLMFVQISPSERDLSETLSSLNFATRVRGIELGPAKKQIDTSELQKVKAMLEKTRQESRYKEESLKKLEESLQNMENKAKGKDHVHKNQQEKIKELENQLEQKALLERQVSQLSERLKGKEETCTSYQQKVKELEVKLREKQQSESTTYQLKVKELENKLKERKEQVQESESHTLTLQQKVKELENKLKEQEQSSEIQMLRLKIKELEEKLREQEKQQQCAQIRDIADSGKATPDTGKTFTRDDDFMMDIESHILKNSNSISRPWSQGSVLPRGSDVRRETTKKRHSRSGETENEMLPPFRDNRGRKSDPPKVARVMRTAAAAARPVAATAAQGPYKRISRDQPQGIKERDTKKKIWNR